MSFASKLFGKDKMKQNETLNKVQAGLRNEMVGDFGRYSTGAIDALGGFAQEGYNPYDEIGGDELVSRMRDQLGIDHAKNQRAFANSNIGKRFSYANAAGMNQMNNMHSKNLTDLDYQNLIAKTGFRQQGYQNQNNAINSLLQGTQGVLGSTQNMTQMHKPGALDYLGGIGSGVSTLKGLF